ncbi:hypothetical protein Y032_0285g1350 [Ancylostoma ceylanicum]|uniref:TPM domain-containing protein n=1 Tax=Ancylostoma ceylanicum TaxID=53326 RepID=A0A016S712_9BILA|nr:hypothetical protein Y032_0285g1350 [Ancylostoma ceylanicum]
MWWILLSLVGLSVQQQWTPEEYPNPRTGGYKQCKMRSASNVCDPDEVLSESSRYRLNAELTRMASRTETNGNTFCTKKGMDAVLAITRQGSQQLADGLRNLWHMDDQCKRSAVFLLSADDRRLYFAPQSNTVLKEAEFQSIVSANDVQLQSGDFVPALVNIFKEIGKKTDIEPVPTPHDGNKFASTIAYYVSTAVALLLTL